MLRRCLFTILIGWLSVQIAVSQEPQKLKLLFLGDNGHHKPFERYRQLQDALRKRGIDIHYAGNAKALNPKTLAGFDGLIIYANIDDITPEQEKALIDYVESGKGFIPLHCASFCFRNSNKFVELVGAQFKSHTTGIFRTQVGETDHPIMKGYKPFESWDETYVHTKHNEKDRTVLEYRMEGSRKEPWTWVRAYDNVRVFYTAWGHDERTWSNPGFINLVERGIRWACNQDVSQVPSFSDQPTMTKIEKDLKPFEYVEAKIPFYPPSQRWGTMGEPVNKMQKPLPAEESMKHIVHPDDFELKLFASEPEIGGKPIAMNWDERGRLWILLTVDYPNEMQPRGKGRDKILICEDVNHDGKADKFTVFADKLSIPTSLIFANGGVIVNQAPDTLFLKDTNGDDIADERKVLFTGWDTGDTHAGPSNLNYGFDNWLYGMVGYAGFVGDVGGQRHSFRTGFYRFKPDGSKIEFLRNTNNNSWGVSFTEEGFLFGSTANGCPSVYLAIPNRYYESVRGWSSSVLQSIAFENRIQPITEKIRQVDWHGGFTAGAGHAIYTARTYPKAYWNRTAFISEPTGHLTSTFLLQEYGTDFRSRYAWNLVASDDEWVAPTSAEVGPDGNVWVIDWYNFIVQHNPTPQGYKTGKGNAYEIELRDKKHARIYRLVPKNAKSEEPFNLKDASAIKLVQTLSHSNLFWRKHAQRLLVERGNTDVVSALVKLASDKSVDEIGLNVRSIHALWTLNGHKGIDPKDPTTLEMIETVFDHPSAAVRRTALMTIPHTKETTKYFVDPKRFQDPNLHVRLAALLALTEEPKSSEAAKRTAESLRDPVNLVDRWILDACVSAAASQDEEFLLSLTQSTASIDAKMLNVIGIVTEHYARGGPSNSVGNLLAKLGDADPKVAEVVLASLAKGWPRNKTAELTEAQEKSMATLMTKASPAAKSNILKLANAWGSKGIQKYTEEIARSLFQVIEDEKQSDTNRIESAKQLVELRGTEASSIAKLLEAISPRTSPQLAVGIIEALGNAGTSEAATAILKRFQTLSPSARTAALRVLLSRKESTRLLLDAMEKGDIQFTELTLDQKQSLATHSDNPIATRAKKMLASGGGLPNADRQKVIDELAEVTKKTGNPGLGKAIFTKHCAVCHTYGNEGNKVGPDLTGMNVHPKEELLIHVLDPNRSVEGNFRLYRITLVDGKLLEGMLISETKTSIELIDQQAKRHVIIREDIEKQVASQRSVMPEGFEKQMTPEELTNLLEFLTQRGKYVPIPLDKAATIVSTKGMFFEEDSEIERMIFRDWKPKTFEGVPFLLVDPQGDKVPNVILLHGPEGKTAPKMPKEVTLSCNSPAKAIHFLSGVSGWGSPIGEKGSVSMIVRLHYEDGKTEDHELKNGIHFADYIRRIDVPDSKFAFALRDQQIRYLSIQPKREVTISKIDLVKGSDQSAPIVMAVTVETK